MTPSLTNYLFYPTSITIPAIKGNLSSKNFLPLPTYAWRDEFTTQRAAGAINNTTSEPGPTLTRTVTDTAAVMVINSSNILDTVAPKGSPSSGDPSVRTNNGIARAAGLTFFFKAKPGVTNQQCYVGLLNSSTNNLTHFIGEMFNSTGFIQLMSYDEASPYLNGKSQDTYASQFYDLAIMVGTTGYYFFHRIDNRWKLVFSSDYGTSTPLYPVISGYSGSIQVDYERQVTKSLFLPAPLLSDGFSSASASDGLGHPENNGGSGKTWTDWLGTFGVSGGKAVASALDGTLSPAIRVTNLNTTNVYATATLTRPTSGEVGIVLAGRDASNYISITHDGTQIGVWGCRAGSRTLIIHSAVAFGAGLLRVGLYRPPNGLTRVVLNWNGTGVGTDPLGVWAGELAGTYAGMFSSTLDNTIDNLVIYPVGGEDQYAWMDTYAGENQIFKTSEKMVVFDGNSLTAGGNLTTDYPFVTLTSLGGVYVGVDVGIGGSTIAATNARASYVDTFYKSTRSKNICCIWEGANDLSADPATTYASLKTYWAARRAAGWKVIAYTVTPRGSDGTQETNRQSLNTNIKSDATLYDALVDVGNDATIGVAGAQNNTTYYQGDKTHLTPTGYAIVAGLAVTAIQSLG